MARFEMNNGGFEGATGAEQAEMMRKVGMMYAIGRDCEVDLVAAHKWLNIAAIKGSARAGKLRAELASVLTKQQLVQALREAREWMTVH